MSESRLNWSPFRLWLLDTYESLSGIYAAVPLVDGGWDYDDGSDRAHAE